MFNDKFPQKESIYILYIYYWIEKNLFALVIKKKKEIKNLTNTMNVIMNN